MVATHAASRLDPNGAVWFLRVMYATGRPLSATQHHVRYVAVEASTETEARTLAAQMVGTQQGSTLGRPHPEMVLEVTILGCEV